MNDQQLKEALCKKNINGVDHIFLEPKLLKKIFESDELTARWCSLLTQDLYDWFMGVASVVIARRREALNSEVNSTRKIPLTTVFNDEKK